MEILVSKVWKRVMGAVEYAGMFCDLDSVQEFRRLYNSPQGRIHSQIHTTSISKFRLRALKGNYAYCRTKGSDINVFSDTFRKKYHLPPTDLRSIRKILDLGSNIGLTIAHFACLYPEAQVLGVELDAQNVELCRKNIAPYSSRCRVIWGAVWNESGEVTYSGEDEWGFHVTPGRVSNRTVSAYTMPTLIQELGAPIDYVKIDVEGAEAVLLKEASSWTNHVRCMKIEIHEPYSVQECLEDVQKLGFRAVLDDHRPACLIAYNPALS